MNLNDLQEAWNREEGGENELKLNLVALKEAHQPLESIRKNMKLELYVQLAAIGFLAFAPAYFGITGKLMMAYYSLYALMLAVSGYYFYRFYLFFKRMHNYNANAKDNLYELYYEIRLNIEMYKSLSYLIFPFALVIGGMIGYSFNMNENPRDTILINENDGIILPVLAIIITLFLIAATNWWVNYFYGKHAKRIRKILDDLKE
jgi:hypothetical protein